MSCGRFFQLVDMLLICLTGLKDEIFLGCYLMGEWTIKIVCKNLYTR
jgi:hypothetical protein